MSNLYVHISLKHKHLLKLLFIILVMIKLQKFKEQFSITIPKVLIESKGWKKGQNLKVVFNHKGNLEITEVKEE